MESMAKFNLNRVDRSLRLDELKRFIEFWAGSGKNRFRLNRERNTTRLDFM